MIDEEVPYQEFTNKNKPNTDILESHNQTSLSTFIEILWFWNELIFLWHNIYFPTDKESSFHKNKLCKFLESGGILELFLI